jgi:hypothetical protein
MPIHGLDQHVRKEIRIRWCCRTNSEGRHRSSIAPVAGLRPGPPADERAFLDYLLSEAGQRYFAEQTSEYPMIAGIAVTAGQPELSQLSHTTRQRPERPGQPAGDARHDLRVRARPLTAADQDQDPYAGPSCPVNQTSG